MSLPSPPSPDGLIARQNDLWTWSPSSLRPAPAFHWQVPWELLGGPSQQCARAPPASPAAPGGGGLSQRPALPLPPLQPSARDVWMQQLAQSLSQAAAAGGQHRPASPSGDSDASARTLQPPTSGHRRSESFPVYLLVPDLAYSSPAAGKRRASLPSRAPRDFTTGSDDSPLENPPSAGPSRQKRKVQPALDLTREAPDSPPPGGYPDSESSNDNMPEKPSYYELYRRSSIGCAIMDALDTFISQRRMEPQLAIKIIEHFDRCMEEVLREKVKARMTFKGQLDTYRFCDEVWTFIIKDVNMKLENSVNLKADKIKIVAMNSKKPGEA